MNTPATSLKDMDEGSPLRSLSLPVQSPRDTPTSSGVQAPTRVQPSGVQLSSPSHVHHVQRSEVDLGGHDRDTTLATASQSGTSAELTARQKATEAKTARLQPRVDEHKLDVLLMVSMILLVVCAVLVPYLAWQRTSDQHNRELRMQQDEELETSALVYLAVVERTLRTVLSEMSHMATVMQRGVSIERFYDFTASSATSTSYRSTLWIERVLHANRSAFESEVYNETVRYFNSSEGIASTITEAVIQNSSIVGVEPRSAQPEYSVARYQNPLSLISVLLDLDTVPFTRAALAQAINATEPVVIKRSVSYGNRSAAMVMLPVSKPSSPNELLGVVGEWIWWGTFLNVELDRSLASQPMHLRVYDITGDSGGVSGCVLPHLFDAEQRGGAWTELVSPLSAECHASRGDVPKLPYEFEIDVGGRVLLLSFGPSSTFEYLSSVPDPAVLMLAGALAMFVLLQAGIVVLRGLRLIHDANYARADAETMHESTKRFFSFITHELRNPLFGVLGLAGELRNDLKQGNTAPEHLLEGVNYIERASNRMTSIINDVLSLRKLEESKLDLEEEPFDIFFVSEEIRTTFAARATMHEVTLRVEATTTLPPSLLGDATRVVQVLSNLVSNAIKFTPAGGCVCVRFQAMYSMAEVREWEVHSSSRQAAARTEAPPRCQTVSAGASESPGTFYSPARSLSRRLANDTAVERCWLLMSVEDTGAGIPADVVPRLFQPYEQESASTSRKHGGTGLGLAIVKMLVTLMDGRIFVASEVGQGTQFSVLIPFEVCKDDMEVDQRSFYSERNASAVDSRSDGGLLHRAFSARFGEAPVGKSSEWVDQQILVVDDQRINLRIMKHMLSQAMPGLVVDTASNGMEALERVNSRQRPYSMVLMDIVMPIMDGCEAMHQLRSRGYTGSVVAVTGASDEQEIEGIMGCGFDGLAQKPLQTADLLALIRQHCNRRSTKSEP